MLCRLPVLHYTIHSVVSFKLLVVFVSVNWLINELENLLLLYEITQKSTTTKNQENGTKNFLSFFFHSSLSLSVLCVSLLI